MKIRRDVKPVNSTISDQTLIKTDVDLIAGAFMDDL